MFWKHLGRGLVTVLVVLGLSAAAAGLQSATANADDGYYLPDYGQQVYVDQWQPPPPQDWDPQRWGPPVQLPPPPPPPQQWEPDWWWHADYYEARRVPRDQWGNLDPAYAGVTIRFSGRFGTDYFVCDRPGWRLEERGSKVYYVSDYWNH